MKKFKPPETINRPCKAKNDTLGNALHRTVNPSNLKAKPLNNSQQQFVDSLQKERENKSAKWYTSQVMELMRGMYVAGYAPSVIGYFLKIEAPKISQIVHRKDWASIRKQTKRQIQNNFTRKEIETSMKAQVTAEVSKTKEWIEMMSQRTQIASLRAMNIVDYEIANSDSFRMQAAVGSVKGLVGIAKDLSTHKKCIEEKNDERNKSALSVVYVSSDFKPLKAEPGDPEVIELEEYTQEALDKFRSEFKSRNLKNSQISIKE